MLLKGENLNNQLKSKALLDTNTSNLITYCFLFYIFISLSIFVISESILDKSQICSNFVNFMKQFFPNIEIFESVSPLPQLTAFYTSFMWIWGIALGFMNIFAVYKSKYNIRINLPNTNIFGYIFLILICCFGLYAYFSGYIATNGISFGAKKINLYFDNRLNIFMPIAIFQFIFSIAFLAIPISSYVLFLKIKNYFKEINK